MSVVDHGLRAPISRFIRLLLLATAFVLAAALFAAANASAAIGVSSFSLSPSTTASGANPNLAITATRSGSSSDDLKTATLKLPAGLNYSLAGAPKCSSSAFAQDNCPSSTVLGTASLNGTLSLVGFSLLSGAANGTVYALSSTQYGVVYRPSGLPKILVKTTISGTVGAGLSLASGDYPRTAYLFGLFPLDLTIAGISSSLSGKSGVGGTGPVVITNPTTCGPASSTLTFRAYNGTSGSKSSSFNVTGCTEPTGPTGEPTGPTGEPTGPTGEPTGPTGEPTGPTGEPTGPTGEPTGPTGEPTGPTGPPEDTTPPVITITAPEDGSTTTEASTTLTYMATDNSGATPTCDKASGSSQPLSLGSNTISVTCQDAATNSATASVSVTRVSPPDTTPPVITITAPEDDSTTTEASTTLTYTATDNSGATPTCDKASGSSQPLVLGENTITVTCQDAATNSASASVTVTRTNAPDTTAPVITITAPEDDSETTEASTTLTYTATDDSGATPTCDKASGSSQPLTLGENTITVTCEDASSNSSSASVTVTRTTVPDTTPPVITITAPEDDSTTTEASTTLTYTATDDSGATPTCDKASGSSQPLVLGENTITVTCEDASSNSASASVTVTRTNVPDTTAPVITITAPEDDSTTTEASTTLTYTATDDSGATPTCDKASGSSQPLTLGENTITVTCEDASSNSSSASVTVTRVTPPDTTPPVITITAPEDDSTTTEASTTLTYTATDDSGATPTCDKASGSSQPLVLGENTITVTCEDAASNSASASVTVTRTNVPDTTAPVITITAPEDDSTTTEASTTLTYTATDDSGAAPTCDKASGSSQPLVLGENTITVTCEDAASNSSSASVTVTRVTPPDTTPPVITITAPEDDSTTTEASTTLTYTATDDSGATPTCDKASGSSQPLTLGENTITVTCEDAASNSSSASVTVTRVTPPDTTPPVITITAPEDDSTTTEASTTLTYTATDDSGATPTCDKASGSSQPLTVGENTITVTCEDAASNSASASVTVTRTEIVTPPELTVSEFAPPSTNGTSARSVTFSGTGATSYECRSGFGNGASAVGTAAWTTCTSPWPVAIPAGITDGTNIEYEVRAQNAGGPSDAVKGFTWYDTRAFTATPTVAAQPNSITPAGTQTNAGAHPDVTASLAVQGYDDGKTVTVTFPDGLMGSLNSIPKASRCTPDQATAGTCPLSAKIGEATGTATSETDGTVTATGNLYLVDATPASGTQLDPAYAAGVALSIKDIVGPITPNLGDINAQGFLAINDAARNLKVQIDDIPNETTTGNRFHVQSASLTVEGDTGGAANPLITNPHFCGPFNTNRRSPGSAAFGSFPAVTGATANNFYGRGTSYQGNTTPEIQAAYNVVNCNLIPFNPTMTIGLSSLAAGTSTALTSTINVPFDHSTIRNITVRLPSFVAPDFTAFGTASDQCSAGAYTGGATGAYIQSPSAFGTGTLAYREFTPVNCPPQAIIGTAIISSPLLDQPVTGDVYLANSSPIPNIGIYVDPNKYGNPQGIRIGLFGTTSTPQVDLLCDPLESACPTQIVAQFTSAPDVPVSQIDLTMGNKTGRALGPNALLIATPEDPACVNAGAPWLASFNTWSSTTATNRNGILTPTGCNQ
jgi:hypothetical protein